MAKRNTPDELIFLQEHCLLYRKEKGKWADHRQNNCCDPKTCVKCGWNVPEKDEKK